MDKKHKPLTSDMERVKHRELKLMRRCGMVFGECPYCGEPFALASPDKTPQMAKVTCEKCGKWFWEYFSRIEPRSYLPEEVEVDELNKTVKILTKEGK